MKKTRPIWGLTVLLTVSMVISAMGFPQLGYAQTQQGTPTVVQQEIINAFPVEIPAATHRTQSYSDSVKKSWGLTDDGAGVFIESHASQSTKTYAFGSKVTVTIHCYDKYDKNQYVGYFGIWDEVKQEYVQSYSTNPIVSYDEIWQGTFDLSKLVVSTGRYEVDALLYDTVSETFIAYDYFKLNISNLTAPTLSVATSGVHSLNLTWTTPYSGASYRVYKATSSTGTYSYIGKTSGKSYSVTGLTSGKTYYFKVKPYVTYGTTTKYGTLSSAKSGVPKPLTPSVTLTSTGYDSQKISWKAISGANGYYIYRATSSTGTYTYLGSTTGTYKTYTGLVTGKNYYYRVKAYHTESSGTKIYSSYSTTKYGKPIPTTPYATGTLSTYNSIKLVWPAVSGANGYELYRGILINGQNTVYQKIATFSSSVRSYVDKSLQLETTYLYYVMTYHVENGVKIYSLTPMQLALASPRVLTMGIPVIDVIYESGASVELSWNPIWGSSYQIWRKESSQSDSSYTMLGTCNTTPPSYTDTTAIPGKTYIYKVVTRRYEDAGVIYSPAAYSKEVTIKVSTPSLYASTNSFADRIVVQWYNNPNDGATKFIVERSTDDVNYTQIADLTRADQWQDYSDYAATPGQTYYYRIRGYYNDLTVVSDWSNVVQSSIPI
jgi:fibronectin type 3 domain-containing protein